jgi:hypothetical protein
MRSLTAYRQPLAVAQPAITTEIHQPLDVHCYKPTQIPLDGKFAVDHFAHAQDFVVGQLVDPPFGRNADPVTDLEGGASPDPMNISEPNGHSLLVRDIDASYTRHLRFSSTDSKMITGGARHKGWHYIGAGAHVNPGCGI